MRHWLLHEYWKSESGYKLHPEIVDMNYVQEERQDSLSKRCFVDTPGDFSNKIRKYSLFTRWLSTCRDGRKMQEKGEIAATGDYKYLRKKWTKHEST